jgi:hypothetical protein
MTTIVWDTCASIEAERFTILAASWYTSALTSHRVEELLWAAFALIKACFTNTTVFIPPSSARAFPDNHSDTTNNFFYLRNSSAFTFAMLAIPEVVSGANLRIAFTCAVNCVPVVGIIKASLRHALPCASKDVESYVARLNFLHLANTSFKIFVEISFKPI